MDILKIAEVCELELNGKCHEASKRSPDVAQRNPGETSQRLAALSLFIQPALAPSSSISRISFQSIRATLADRPNSLTAMDGRTHRNARRVQSEIGAEVGHYGEAKGLRVVGVEFNGITFLTPKHQWTIQYNEKQKRFEVDDSANQEGEHNYTLVPGGARESREISGKNPGPFPGRFKPSPENPGPGSGTELGTGQELPGDFSKLAALSALSYLEFCQ